MFDKGIILAFAVFIYMAFGPLILTFVGINLELKGFDPGVSIVDNYISVSWFWVSFTGFLSGFLFCVYGFINLVTERG